MTQSRQSGFRALVIDDEADIRQLLEMSLQRMGGASLAAAGVAEAIELLNNETFDLCFTDMRMPDGSGYDVLAHIAEHRPELPVAVITAYGNVEDAVESLQAGAFDFISKPVDTQAIAQLVDKALRLKQTPQQDTTAASDELVGNTPAIQALRALIDKLARNQAPVYISGESGTGKERVARLIHAKGPRSEAPFVPVNCGAIPTELMESEFFGHIKGSFTGAVKDKAGLFMAAQGGSLFLDEIAELPMPMQVKLLRAIQERKVRAVGSERETPFDVRILCATHRPLSVMVAEGQFRKDLYYRINVIQAHVPALRDRLSDIPTLCDSLLAGVAERNGLTSPPRLDAAALSALQNYPFPGNVRELENILERASALAEGDTIHVEDLLLESREASTPSPKADDDPEETRGKAALKARMEAEEKAMIRQALEQCRYNKTQTAELLGLSFRQLRYRIKKLGLE